MKKIVVLVALESLTAAAPSAGATSAKTTKGSNSRLFERFATVHHAKDWSGGRDALAARSRDAPIPSHDRRRCARWRRCDVDDRSERPEG